MGEEAALLPLLASCRLMLPGHRHFGSSLPERSLLAIRLWQAGHCHRCGLLGKVGLEREANPAQRSFLLPSMALMASFTYGLAKSSLIEGRDLATFSLSARLTSKTILGTGLCALHQQLVDEIVQLWPAAEVPIMDTSSWHLDAKAGASRTTVWDPRFAHRDSACHADVLHACKGHNDH